MEKQAPKAGELEVLQNGGMPHLRERVHGVPGVLQAKEILQPVLRQSRQGSRKEREMFGNSMNPLLILAGVLLASAWIRVISDSGGECRYDNCWSCPYAGACSWERRR